MTAVLGADAIQLAVKGKSEREYQLAGYQIVVADDASQGILAAAAGVHTLGPGDLLPYAEFDKHPEYFALVNGKRVRLSVQYAIMLFADKNDPIRGTAIQNFFPVAERTNLRVLFNPETGRQVDLERFQKDFLDLEP